MGILDKINTAGKGVTNKVAEAVEYGVASYVYGYVQSRWREKASVAGIPADLVSGVVFKAASIAADLWGGKSLMKAAPHANVLGNTGIGAFFHTFGAGHGAQSSGVKRVLVKESDLPKLKGMNVTVLGAIPKAPHGDYLNSRDLAELSKS